MAVADAADPLERLCADLRLLRRQAGGPSLRALGERLGMGKSQLGAILNGQVRELPDWRLVRGLVEACVQYAREHGRTASVSLPTGIEEFWRRRYTMAEHALDDQAQPRDAATTHTPAAVPRQLPPPVRRFVGRAAELAELTGLLDAADVSPVVISAIGGTAGVGKTTLAVHWAHQVAGRFPDGQVYANLRGFDPGGAPTGPGLVLRGFIEAFGVPPESIPADLDALAARYRGLLSGKRVLVVLDNARDAEQVRPLLPATPGCLALVTSRDRLTGLVATEDAHPVQLDLLAPGEAHDMLRQRLGARRVAAEPDAAAEIVERCAGLPLALAVTAARAAVEPQRRLGAIAEDLREARESLEVFASRDPAVDLRVVFSCSYDALGGAASRLFRLLALAPGPDIALPAASALAGLPPARTRALLSELARAHLIAEHRTGRYTFHDLLRAYALELARRHDTPDARLDAVRRVLDHYLHTAYAADRLLYTHRDPIALDPAAPGVRPEAVTGQEQALAWFTAERPALLAGVELAYGRGLYAHAWRLAWALATHFLRQGHWREWATAQETGLEAARRLGDRGAQAIGHRTLARALTRLGRYDEAYRHLDEAVRLHGELGEPAGQAHAHLNIGEAYLRQHLLTDALRHAERALELYRLAGHEAGQANALNNIGWLYAQLGDDEQAVRRCERALVLHGRTGDLQGEATTWDSLGDIHQRRAEYPDAVTCYERAVARYRELGDRYYEALALASLGDTRHLMRQLDAARALWRTALGILTDLDHPDAATIMARLNRLAEEGALAATE